MLKIGPASGLINGIRVSTVGGSLESCVMWRSAETKMYAAATQPATSASVDAIACYCPWPDLAL